MTAGNQGESGASREAGGRQEGKKGGRVAGQKGAEGQLISRGWRVCGAGDEGNSVGGRRDTKNVACVFPRQRLMRGLPLCLHH